MRMTASWLGRYGPTEYKVVARYFAPDGKLPSDRFVVPLKNNRSTNEISVDRGFSHFVSSMTAPIASGWSGSWSGGSANWRLRSGRRLTDRIPSEECTYRRPTGPLRPSGSASGSCETRTEKDSADPGSGQVNCSTDGPKCPLALAWA
jgi:hypothetical protein